MKIPRDGTVERGGIYLIPASEEEPDGKKRPILIVANDELCKGRSVLAVPFSTKQLEKRKQQTWCVFFPAGESNLDDDCVARCDATMQVDRAVIDWQKGKIGEVSDEKMQAVVRALVMAAGYRLPAAS